MTIQQLKDAKWVAHIYTVEELNQFKADATGIYYNEGFYGKYERTVPVRFSEYFQGSYRVMCNPSGMPAPQGYGQYWELDTWYESECKFMRIRNLVFVLEMVKDAD